MGYIAPNTTVKLLHECPLDNTYEHTLYFYTKADQTNYFNTLVKKTFPEQTYQRVNKGVMRLQVCADDIYACNYLMFQNTNFGSKWFYCFITSVEYVSNNVAEITYEIDVMQTWFFDYTLQQCFIEREHVISDTVGSNLIPDDLETGDYISSDFDATGKMGSYSIVVASTFDTNLDAKSGGKYCGIYSGIYFNVFSSATEVNSFIDSATEANKSDGIVAVFMMPTAFVGGIDSSPQNYDITKDKKLDSIDGYVPKNKKLFTYPYNFLYVTNLNGNSAEFHYEYFSGSKCTFGLTGDMSCNPQVVLYPQNYKGVPANYNEKMVVDGFPQCAYNTDSFKAWLAQSASSLLSQTAGQILDFSRATTMASLAGAGTLASYGFGAIGAGLGVASILGSVLQHATLPRHAQNSQGNSVMTALAIKDFAFMHMHIRAEFAKIIDDYWSMFGYPVHEVKHPNRSARPHWNYVKTRGCIITGNVPSDASNKICKIHDNGITYWKKGSEVGNYSLDNRIV